MVKYLPNEKPIICSKCGKIFLKEILKFLKVPNLLLVFYYSHPMHHFSLRSRSPNCQEYCVSLVSKWHINFMWFPTPLWIFKDTIMCVVIFTPYPTGTVKISTSIRRRYFAGDFQRFFDVFSTPTKNRRNVDVESTSNVKIVTLFRRPVEIFLYGFQRFFDVEISTSNRCRNCPLGSFQY